MASASPIDRFVALDSKRVRIFSSLKKNIMNMNKKIE
jgi:hypothetical protein